MSLFILLNNWSGLVASEPAQPNENPNNNLNLPSRPSPRPPETIPSPIPEEPIESPSTFPENIPQNCPESITIERFEFPDYQSSVFKVEDLTEVTDVFLDRPLSCAGLFQAAKAISSYTPIEIISLRFHFFLLNLSKTMVKVSLQSKLSKEY